ncbi:MAG: hypothetical protein ACR2M3_18180 [Thermomicrobiales bacterium]
MKTLEAFSFGAGLLSIVVTPLLYLSVPGKGQGMIVLIIVR